MPTIQLSTRIHGPVERCFDLSRSIDMHLISTEQTGEKAIAGRTSGLIEMGEEVTWRARHLGFWQTLTSRITEFQYPTYFVDEMVKGIFRRMRHEHHFHQEGDTTQMTDIFFFESPLGIAGRVANGLFVTRYMKQLLIQRNAAIRRFAETNEWQRVLER